MSFLEGGAKTRATRAHHDVIYMQRDQGMSLAEEHATTSQDTCEGMCEDGETTYNRMISAKRLHYVTPRGNCIDIAGHGAKKVECTEGSSKDLPHINRRSQYKDTKTHH